ncbi:MAG: rhomboid family intramembrane serine protease [Rhizobiales bacterium]|jgi:membrane associated rhomboid family serine protease|nr:rhomboid family intramembrane serine protease [Hyphomicrobiales bacterium]
MLVPLKDDNPLQVIRFQVVTALIVAVNVVIFFFTGALARPEFSSAIASAYGVVPVELFSPGMIVPMSLEPVPEPVTLITYMFLHGGWLHLLFNMAFLWVFADNVEDAFGHVGFLLFYVLCGIAGGLMHAIMQPLSQLPVIGASGAVSGVLGAYILLFPKARLWIFFYLPVPFRIPAIIVLGAWFALQVLGVFTPVEEGQLVAWWAHIGGFVTGLLLTLLLRSRLLVRT